MKKIILFCLSACLLGMLILGCPNDTNTVDTQPVDSRVTYTVNFDSNGGQGSMPAITFKQGDDKSLPENTFTWANNEYIFVSWSDKADGTGNKFFDTAKVSELVFGEGTSVTLYAQWIKLVHYTIKFDANNGEGTIPDITIESNPVITIPKCTFNYEGYVFTGWNTKADGKGTEYDEDVSVYNLTEEENATVTLYAQWRIITYSVIFDRNGGYVLSFTKKMSDLKYTDVKTLTKCGYTKEGYIFDKWNTKIDGSGTEYTDEQEITKLTTNDQEEIKLYAQWRPISYTIKFMPNGADGDGITQNLLYDTESSLTLNSFTAPAGKAFAYWSDNSTDDNTNDKGNAYIDGQTVFNLTVTDGDVITLYAHWLNEGEYAILYYDPQRVNNANPVTYTAENNIMLNDLTTDGYSFLGWYDSDGEIFESNKILDWIAGSKTGTVQLWAKWATGNVVAKPGDIEQLPDIIFVLRQARQQINPKENEVVFFYMRDDGQYSDWAMWFWATGSDGANNWDAISAHGFDTVTIDDHVIGYMKFNSEGTDENGCIPVTNKEQETIKNKGKFNFIVRKKDGWTKDYEGDLYWELMEGNYFGQLSGNPDVYSIADDAKPQIMNAIMLDDNHLMIGLSQKYAVTLLPSANNFTFKSDSNTSLAIKDMYSSALYQNIDVDGKRAQYNYSKQFIVTIEDGIDYTKDWYISHPEFGPKGGYKVSLTNALKTNIVDMEYTGNDLGLTLSGTKAGFKVFAPIATEVNLLLYSSWEDAKKDIDNAFKDQKTDDALTNGTRVSMTKAADFENTGIWEKSDVDVSGKNYYVYELNNIGKVYRVCDINALVASPDSIAAQIIDINDSACKPTGWETSYTNPFGNSGADTKTYTEAIIYEMHIRDWSKGLSSSNKGKFDEITAGLGTNGDGVLGQHLKDLGITHVQILPMFDYAQTNADNDYNWGYNPYHYNVPEGRYVNNHDNGGQEAVKQMRGMIKAFHDAGIAVNMDVVYNHTNGTGFGSLYDMTVPSYYYRLDNGAYSNGSGCGNETDSSMPMYRKYMIDSLSHWMRDYHINGFRFDLMGLHEHETMAAIYAALSQIDKNVMVYGEPWDGGNSQCKNAAKKAGTSGNYGYGAFDDEFRNAIKGGEYGGFEKGQVQGTFEDDKIITGLTGATTTRNDTGNAGLSIHYVECHDNYTLFDKLDISILNGQGKDDWKAYDSLTTAQQNAIRAQNKLSAAFVLLAQGTPFMNGGQEFMRTKQGDENSYISSDEINAIDLGFKTTYSDVYNVYKGLIKLRRTYDAFTAGSNIVAEKVKNGVTKYTVSGTNGSFCIYFNATTSTASINTAGYTKVIDVTNGTLEESTTLPKTVSGTNFVILKK